MTYDDIREQAAAAAKELLDVARLKKGDIFVIGCSSSEIKGKHIGKDSDINAAKAVYDGIYPLLKERGIYLAAQCCEHLNRAIITEEAALLPGTEICNVVPQMHAGGSFAMTVYQNAEHPVAVEHIKAAAGMDIGDTLIGMNLRDVAVPTSATPFCWRPGHGPSSSAASGPYTTTYCPAGISRGRRSTINNISSAQQVRRGLLSLR